MRIQVLYFAVVRERVHRDEQTIELADGATIARLLDELCRQHPSIAALRPHLATARNRELARADTPLTDGDQVALIPPVAGGEGPPGQRPPRPSTISATALDLAEVLREVSHDGAGGIVSFTGLVRRESRGRRVERLEYEAYGAMADERIRAIISHLESTVPGVRVAIRHRVGRLAVGEVAVVIAASAPHRAEAFGACREAIEQLKVGVPIWKKEIGDDGEEWIGLGP